MDAKDQYAGKHKHLDKEELAAEAKEFEAYAANKGEKRESPNAVFNPEDKSKVVLTYFSESRVNMCRAILDHRALCTVIAHLNPETDWEAIIAEVAAYCNLVLDGLYTPSAMEKLYQELFMRLTVIPVRMDYAEYLRNTNQDDFDPANWDKFLKPKNIYTGKQ